MNRLEDLVPPLELCRQLKPGQFKDSIYAFRRIARPLIETKPEYAICLHTACLNYEHFPAPTLEEILAAFGDKHFCIFSATPGRWVVVHGGGDSDVDEKASAAALRLFLEVAK